jgi:hypothetical protein
MKRFVIAGMMAAAAIAGCATAAAPLKPAEARIPFVNHGGIYDWEAAGRDTLYIQDVHRKWYRASLMGTCLDLDFARAIGFESGATDTLDRFSSIVVRGQRCPITSLIASGPPPRKEHKH